MGEPEPVDVLLLTHSSEETAAIISTLFRDDDRRATILPEGWRYYRSYWEGDRAYFPFAVAGVLQGATTSPGMKARQLVAHLRPRYVVSCGAANPTKGSRVGDVVVARNLPLFDEGGDPLDELASPSRDRQSVRSLLVPIEEFVNDGLWAEIARKTSDIRSSACFGKIAMTRDPLYVLGASAYVDCRAVEYERGLTELANSSLGVPFIVVRGLAGELDEYAGFSDEGAAVLAARFALTFLAEQFEKPSSSETSSAPPVSPLATLPGLRDAFRNASLEHLHILNFKSVEDLSLDLAHGSELPGRWTCLAGVNGAGKSAVLQAITLALLGPRFATELGGAWLQRLRRTVGGARARATLHATLRVDGRDQRFVLPITERGAALDALPNPIERLTMEPLWDARASHHLLLAYGPGRNLSEHIDSRHDSKSPEVRRVITLFDPLAQVASAEAMLRERSDAPAVIAMARKLLSHVLADMPVTVAEDDAALRFRMGDVALSAVDLPDGFRATIAWLVDLCACWHTLAPEAAKSGDPKDIQALVLLDEIDLHLHPRLQRVLVPRLREALPRVQWIVSTHSPLVLGSFDMREIVMLQSDEHGRVSRREIDRQVMGFTSDEIYQWLMETTPRSAAIERLTATLDEPTAAETQARLLAQSPEHSDDDVRRAYEFRAQRLRQRAATGVREGTASPEDEEPET